MARKKIPIGTKRRTYRTINGKRRLVEVTKLTKGEKVKIVANGKLFYGLTKKEHTHFKDKGYIYEREGKEKAFVYDKNRQELADVLVAGRTRTKQTKSDDVGILWEKQYAPREKYILNNLNAKAKKKWKEQSTSKKMIVIDNLQRKGLFD